MVCNFPHKTQIFPAWHPVLASVTDTENTPAKELTGNILVNSESKGKHKIVRPHIVFLRIICIMLEVFIRKCVLTQMIKARIPTIDRKMTYK